MMDRRPYLSSEKERKIERVAIAIKINRSARSVLAAKKNTWFGTLLPMLKTNV